MQPPPNQRRSGKEIEIDFVIDTGSDVMALTKKHIDELQLEPCGSGHVITTDDKEKQKLAFEAIVIIGDEERCKKIPVYVRHCFSEH